MSRAPAADDFLLEVCDIATLQSAYELAEDGIEEDHDEAWFINIQNHLIWNSYGHGEDLDADLVVLHAIGIVQERRGLCLSEIPGMAADILAGLLPEREEVKDP